MSEPFAASGRILVRAVASRFINRIRERTTKIKMTDQGCMLRGYERRIVDAMTRQ
jgi:undecaprenyl-phosphate 4-deoxy-4-formamido-L-arabinose transferase